MQPGCILMSVQILPVGDTMLEIVYNPPIPQTVKSFTVTFGRVDIPAMEIMGIVDNNFVCWNDDLLCYEGFNKISAIKELREHFQLKTKTYHSMYGFFNLWIGLREAKDMIDAVYNEGVLAGNYRACCDHTEQDRKSNLADHLSRLDSSGQLFKDKVLPF